MTTDHSKTYRLNDIRNLAHVMRLRSILRTLKGNVTRKIATYADFGCSNGFITARVAREIGAESAFGFDHSDNVLLGPALHPEVTFERLNLNLPHSGTRKFDLVTCFETLEHVGNMQAAVDTICKSAAPGGHILVTVPIEIGWIGTLKYVIKRFLFRYELPVACSDRRYLAALLKSERISRYRPAAEGYGSHFGFDYRDVDDLLRRHELKFKVWNSGTTRFYLATCP
jgi:2-polyprenyl-3-methyl-5-hydroxy-6-metoxy-1,4-benzoquinol methylase